MKKILLTILPLLLIVGCSKVEGKQDLIPVVETYRNGNIESITYHKKSRTGIEKVKYEEYYNYGQKFSEGTFKDGKKDGKWTEWYKYGQKKNESTWKNGGLISVKRWNFDGSAKEDEHPSNEHPTNEHPTNDK